MNTFFWVAASAMLGICTGSFLNIIIYRLPRKMSLLHPPSHCPVSGQPIKWYDNISVLSFIFLKGRGRRSGKPIGFQSLVIETLTGLVFALHAIFLPYPQCILATFIAVVAIPLIVIDLKFKQIPPQLTLLPIAIIFITAAFKPEWFAPASQSLHLPVRALQAVFIQTTTALGAFALFYFTAIFILKKEILGLGDVILAGFIGSLFGLQGALNAAALGAAITLLLLPIIRRIPHPFTPDMPGERRELARIASDLKTDDLAYLQNVDQKLQDIFEKTPKPKNIPFGPGLIIACYIQYTSGFDTFSALSKLGAFLAGLAGKLPWVFA